MERRRLPYAGKITEAFLMASFSTGAHLRVGELASSNPRLRWALDAVALYYGNPTSYGDVGRALQPLTTHETARKLVGEGVRAIWEMSGDKVKDEYPLEALPQAKPTHAPFRPHRLGARVSSIIEAVKNGATYAEIRQVHSNEDIGRARGMFKEADVTVPYKTFSQAEHDKITDTASLPDIPRSEYAALIPRLLNNLTTVQHISQTTGAFISLYEALTELGFFVGRNNLAVPRQILTEADLVLNFEKVIKNGKSACQIQRYSFLAERDLGEAETRLYNHPLMDPYRENPVKKMCGYEADIDITTTDLKGNPEISALSELLRRFGLTNGRRSKIPLDKLLEDCKTPVWQYQDRVVYYKPMESFLEEQIKKVARQYELGLL